MGKAVIFLVLIFGMNFNFYAQCSVNSFVEDNYTQYAKILALRVIQNDPSDPDYDNPFIPTARFTSYLEKLSAIYENPEGEPIIDLLFGDYSVNVNAEYNFWTPYKQIALGVDNSAPWLNDFLDTGISGDSTLDDLVSTYDFFIADHFTINNTTTIKLITTTEALNIPALQDEFLAVDFMTYAEPEVTLADRLNYDGTPYFINGEAVTVSDIIVDNNSYTFCLYAGDCFNGCIFSDCWVINVSEDCSTVTLGVSENSLNKFSVFPNPASDIIQIRGVTSEVSSTLIFSVTGRVVYSAISNSETIEISNLDSGMYFLQITSSEGNTQTQKFIKK